MFASVRFCFVVLLVMLQLIAPLIHAHKNDNFTIGASFHLPEFEQVNALLDDGSNMTAPSFREGEMVTVSNGIKDTQRRFLSIDKDDAKLFIGFCLLIVFIFQQTAQRFSIQIAPIKRCRFFNTASPRAPPFSFLN